MIEGKDADECTSFVGLLMQSLSAAAAEAEAEAEAGVAEADNSADTELAEAAVADTAVDSQEGIQAQAQEPAYRAVRHVRGVVQVVHVRGGVHVVHAEQGIRPEVWEASLEQCTLRAAMTTISQSIILTDRRNG
jgi:hypothetical protein